MRINLLTKSIFIVAIIFAGVLPTQFSLAKSYSAVVRDYKKNSKKFLKSAQKITKGLHENPTQTFENYQIIVNQQVRNLLKFGEEFYEIGRSFDNNASKSLQISEEIYKSVLTLSGHEVNIPVGEEAEWHAKKKNGFSDVGFLS